jgi:hypothetical protein
MRKSIRKIATSPHAGSWTMATLLLATATAVLVYHQRAMAGVTQPTASSQSIAPEQLIARYLNGEQGTLVQLQPMLQNTEQLLESCLAEKDKAQVPLAQIRNNPFRLNLSAETANQQAGEAQKNDGDRVAMLQNLEKLQLQSVLGSGDHPACVIDNRLYHEGDEIDDFTVERIETNGVVVRSGGYRFELKLPS